MAIVTIECDGDQTVHDEAARIRRMLAELGLAPVSIGPGTVRNLKLTFPVEFKTEEEAARFLGAVANKLPRRSA